MTNHLSTRIYLDNAATSWPKPPSVVEAITRWLTECGSPAGRGTSRFVQEVEREIWATRQTLLRFVNAPPGYQVVFANNCTDALNIAILGSIPDGSRVLTSHFEHNSVLRPLTALHESGRISLQYLQPDLQFGVNINHLQEEIGRGIDWLVLNHVSNVTGTTAPIELISEIARENQVRMIVDAAQSCGVHQIDLSKWKVDAVAAAGHKGLLGPLGTGVLWLSPELATTIKPTRFGGTGTESFSTRQPEELPHKLESGNLNVPGILGLKAGVEFVLQKSVAAIAEHERNLNRTLINELRLLDTIRLVIPGESEGHLGPVSFVASGWDSREFGEVLQASFEIECRTGFHCAAKIHDFLNTAASGGTIRLSSGPFTSADEIARAIEAIREICRQH